MCSRKGGERDYRPKERDSETRSGFTHFGVSGTGPASGSPLHLRTDCTDRGREAIGNIERKSLHRPVETKLSFTDASDGRRGII